MTTIIETYKGTKCISGSCEKMSDFLDFLNYLLKNEHKNLYSQKDNDDKIFDYCKQNDLKIE